MAEQISKNEIAISQNMSERLLKENSHMNCIVPESKGKCADSTIVRITGLPAEIFQHILRYLTFDHIAKLRLVSRYFNDMCSSLLNSEFNRLRVLVQQRFMAIKAQMPRRESSRRKHPLARESDIIETLYMRLTLLNMTFGKHIERKYCCFFAGEIIDEIYKILEYVQNTPSLSRAYKVTDELFDLSTMAMEYFKEHIEPNLPEVTYFASDVFEYPSFASVKAQHSIIEETVAATSEAASSYQPPNYTVDNLHKRLKLVKKKVYRNSREIANLRRSTKLMSQKINSLGAIVSQLKKEENCDTTIFPLKVNDNNKINKIIDQLNMYKEEIEDLTSKLSACSDKETKIDWESIQSSVNNLRNMSCVGSSLLNTASSVGSSYMSHPKADSSEMNLNNELYMFGPSSLLSTFKSTLKRKLPSSTVTNMIEWSEPKRKHSVMEECDSVNQDGQNSSIS